MTTWVYDCDLDAAKPLRKLLWKVVRTQFAARNFWVLCPKPAPKCNTEVDGPATHPSVDVHDIEGTTHWLSLT